jgi:hypothetical protein
MCSSIRRRRFSCAGLPCPTTISSSTYTSAYCNLPYGFLRGWTGGSSRTRWADFELHGAMGYDTLPYRPLGAVALPHPIPRGAVAGPSSRSTRWPNRSPSRWWCRRSVVTRSNPLEVRVGMQSGAPHLPCKAMPLQRWNVLVCHGNPVKAIRYVQLDHVNRPMLRVGMVNFVQ